MPRTLMAAALVLAAGLWILYEATWGFQAFTQETARRVSVRQDPRPVPELLLQRQDGARVSLDQLEGQLVLATFIYTNCHDVCPVAMARMRNFRSTLGDALKNGELHFLAISFDPEVDTPDKLATYADNFGVDIRHWWLARPRSDLEDMLKFFGVTVIPTKSGMYVHNAAYYLIDREQRLVNIFDVNDPDAVTQAVRNKL